MAFNQLNRQADDYLKDLWENRAVGLAQPLDMLNPIALSYLRNRYPYLQMISSKAIVEETMVPHFKRSPSGWLIHDYGQAMSVSPGKYLFGPGNAEIDTDEGEGGGGGTLIWQSFETAKAMVELAIEKGWPGIEIIGGSPFMEWAAWMAAQDKNYLLVGYEPSQQEKKKRERIVRLRKSQQQEQRYEAEPGPSKSMND